MVQQLMAINKVIRREPIYQEIKATLRDQLGEFEEEIGGMSTDAVP
ncbi:MAG: hypothetical protein U5J62_07965 [Desulfurivibrio sp.]|nr:hypothetical protein [Desulfurivibrio sp.]